MAQLRFIYPEARNVPLLGRLVQPDEMVEVDDDVYLQHLWPEDGWSVVGAPQVPREMPARNAAKDAWVAWAITHGADPDVAREATRDDLIDGYGDVEEEI